MKNIRIFMLMLCVLALLPSDVYAAIPKPSAGFFVNDFAGVITQDEADAITDVNAQIEHTGAQIVVLTVDFTDGMGTEDYALSVHNEWGIGSSQEDNGVLVLLSIGEDDYYLSLGSGIEKYISSGDAAVILDEYMEPYFATGQYGKGLVETVTVLGSKIESFYGTASSDTNMGIAAPQATFGNRLPESNTVSHTKTSTLFSSISRIFSAMFAWIVIMALILGLNSRRRRRAPRFPIPKTRRGRHIHMPPPIPRHRRPPIIPPPMPRSRPPMPMSRPNNTFGGGGRASGGGAGRSMGTGSIGRSSGGGFSGGRASGGGGRASGGGAGRNR